MKGLKANIQLYFVLIVICFAFGQIQQIINNFSGVLGWVFIIITAGLFFYAGGDLVNQGVFSTKKWKVAFVVLLPIVFFVDVFLIKKLSWYNGSSGVAYYTLYTLGFLFKRLPKSDWVQISNPASYYNLGPGGKTKDGTKFVFIGDQIWMAENLRVNTFRNGDIIPEAKTDEEWYMAGQNGEPAWCYYENDPTNGKEYGKLYNWYAVNDPRKLAPEGWHIPSDDEWSQLVNYVVEQGFPNELLDPNGAGNALKSCRQDGSPLEGCNTSEHPRWDSCETNYGFDKFRFSALPGGRRFSRGNFFDVGHSSLWWSATELSGTYAWTRFMFSGNGNVCRNIADKSYGFSVRCIRDTD